MTAQFNNRVCVCPVHRVYNLSHSLLDLCTPLFRDILGRQVGNGTQEIERTHGQEFFIEVRPVAGDDPPHGIRIMGPYGGKELLRAKVSTQGPGVIASKLLTDDAAIHSR